MFCVDFSGTAACYLWMQVYIVLVWLQFPKYTVTVILGDLGTAYQPDLPHPAYVVNKTAKVMWSASVF